VTTSADEKATNTPTGLAVIGFAEALSAPEVAWSLIDAGFKVVAFARRGRRAALRHSRHVEVRDITAPEADSATALSELDSMLETAARATVGPVVLLPLDDSSVWLCSRLAPSTRWWCAGPTGSAAAMALDKVRQIEAARAAGLDVPPTVVVDGTGPLAPGGIPFPLIVRPAMAVIEENGRLRKGANWICSDDTEFARAQSSWNGRDALLVQPYFDGTGEGVFGLATDNGIVAWSAHRRLRMMNPHGSGSSACVSRDVPVGLKAPIAAFLAACNWRGLFMIELLRTIDDRLWFVEFNGRAWGSMALSRRQSLEYPAWAARLAVDPGWRPDAPTNESEPVDCRNVGREMMHVLFVLRGPKSRAVRRWPTLARALSDVCRFGRSSTLYNWRKEDWRVFVSDVWYTLRNNLIKTP
jgi:predicted ATP-grasp superfamily ATP-dependent carboligase